MQIMLDCLSKWCETWGLTINLIIIGKTLFELLLSKELSIILNVVAQVLMFEPLI